MGLMDYEVSYQEISKVLWEKSNGRIITLSKLGIEKFKTGSLKKYVFLRKPVFYETPIQSKRDIHLF